jgi:Mg2+-importing ATPase
MNILCSDKTGTITEGKVTIKNALDVDGNPSENTSVCGSECFLKKFETD